MTPLGLVELFVLFHAVARMCELRTAACGFIGADERQHVLQIHATNGNKSGKNSAIPNLCMSAKKCNRTFSIAKSGAKIQLFFDMCKFILLLQRLRTKKVSATSVIRFLE